MIDTRTYICETCTHESVCKYAKEMKDLEDMLAVSDLKDLKDVASVRVTCRNRTLAGSNFTQYLLHTAKADTARVVTMNQVMAENYGD